MTRKAIIMTLAIAASTPASAHVGVGSTSSALAGFVHPLAGLDHIAAMVAVGVWAALAGGPRVWAWPLAFVAAMLCGGLAGYVGFAVPFVEPMIAASVIVLGLLVASGVRVPMVIGTACVALFGVVHGHAHGTESAGSTFALYAAGFAVATALLHAGGILLGRLIAWTATVWTSRAAGVATVALGATLLLK